MYCKLHLFNITLSLLLEIIHLILSDELRELRRDFQKYINDKLNHYLLPIYIDLSIPNQFDSIYFHFSINSSTSQLQFAMSRHHDMRI